MSLPVVFKSIHLYLNCIPCHDDTSNLLSAKNITISCKTSTRSESIESVEFSIDSQVYPTWLRSTCQKLLSISRKLLLKHTLSNCFKIGSDAPAILCNVLQVCLVEISTGLRHSTSNLSTNRIRRDNATKSMTFGFLMQVVQLALRRGSIPSYGVGPRKRLRSVLRSWPTEEAPFLP